jgi:hypothetical protein
MSLPSATVVSARDLQQECPCSLLVAFEPSHPDQNIWLDSFCEEKSGIQSQTHMSKLVWLSISLSMHKGPIVLSHQCVYLQLRKTKCLTHSALNLGSLPFGNHEDCIWTNSEKHTPVLWPDLMRLITSMAVEKRRTLKQGNCKNMLCQGILPDDENTIIKLPIGDPDVEKDEYCLLKRTIYGLRCSP